MKFILKPSFNLQLRTSNQTLDEIYTNIENPASYSASVKAFLNQKSSLSLHKRKRKNFKRRKWIVPGPFHTICADLIDYQQFSYQNGRNNYILVVVDAFSRVAYTRPLKTKTAEETADKMESILQTLQYLPPIFVSDKGKEFDNKIFSTLMAKYRIQIFFAKGAAKNAIVERWNRTLKTRLHRYFTENKTKRWVDILEQFTKNINASFNRSIGMAPDQVTIANSQKIFKKLHPLEPFSKICKLKLGDIVRKAIEGNIFSKGYTQNWSQELYTVSAIKKSSNFCLYKISIGDDVIDTYFYLDQLNFVRNASV